MLPGELLELTHVAVGELRVVFNLTDQPDRCPPIPVGCCSGPSRPVRAAGGRPDKIVAYECVAVGPDAWTAFD